MGKRKSLLVLIGTVVLLLSLSVPMMQCAPEAVEEEGEEAVVEEEEEEAIVEEEGEIQYGGRLTSGWLTDESLETLGSSEWGYSGMGLMFHRLIYAMVWRMGPAPDYKPIPDFATSWETEDHKTWILHLREDATFHDGVPATAEDVEFIFKYLPPSMTFVETDCESISVIDDYTIKLTLKQSFNTPYPGFGDTGIVPKHIWEPYKDDLTAFANEQGIGCGPFKLKEFKPAQYMWLEANEDYFGGRPYVDELVFRTYGSEDALNMALKSGEIDMIGYYGCSALVAEDFRGTEDIEVIASPGMDLYWLAFNLHQDKPIQDVNVRKAIMYGIDRDRIIDMAYLGYADKVDSLVYPESAEHNPNLPQYDYDPGVANEILDDAGYVDTDGDGIRNDPSTGENVALELMVPSAWSQEVKAGTLICEQLRDIGIDITMKALDLNTYYSFVYYPEEDAYDIALGYEGPSPNGDWVWDYGRSTTVGWNQAYYKNPEFDKFQDMLVSASGPTERKEYVYQLQTMIAEDLPYGLLWRPNIIDPVRTDKFEGWVLSMGGIVSWANHWSYLEMHLK